MDDVLPVWREAWCGSGSENNGDSMRRGAHIIAYSTHLATHGTHVAWLGESAEAHEAAHKICVAHNALMTVVSQPDAATIGYLGCHPNSQPAALVAQVAQPVSVPEGVARVPESWLTSLAYASAVTSGFVASDLRALLDMLAAQQPAGGAE